MTLIMTIKVRTCEAQTVDGNSARIVMIPFDGEAEGEYFTGKTVGTGVDTQITDDEGWKLSARYMLEGTDRAGERCRVFVENNGTSLENCRPRIVTDSKELAFLETADLSAKVECVEGGVIVRIYM